MPAHMILNVQVVHYHTGDHFGIEVGRLLRHLLPRRGNVADLRDPCGVEDKRALEIALIDLHDRFLKELGVGKVDLVRHILLVDTHSLFEDKRVEHAYVKLL